MKPILLGTVVLLWSLLLMRAIGVSAQAATATPVPTAQALSTISPLGSTPQTTGETNTPITQTPVSPTSSATTLPSATATRIVTSTVVELAPLLATLQAVQTLQAMSPTRVSSLGAPLVISPDTLTIDITGGITETRLLLLRATTVITDLQAIVLDLGRPDNRSVISHSKVQVLKTFPISLNSTSIVTMPITLDLRGLDSGVYIGQIRFIHNGGEVNLPITVHVKDEHGLPLVVLFAAVTLGVFITQYRRNGFLLDEVRARFDRLHRDIDELSASYSIDLLREIRSLREAVDKARQALDDLHPEDAETAINDARAIVRTWQNQGGLTQFLRLQQLFNFVVSKFNEGRL